MLQISCVNENKNVTLQSQKRKMVPWMSGLVNGLQNRLQRFESACHLKRRNTKVFFRFLVFLRLCFFRDLTCNKIIYTLVFILYFYKH